MRGHVLEWMRLWDRFWFTPTRPDVLCIMRIATGVLVTYAHLVWFLHQSSFLGTDAWISAEAIQLLHANDHTWSYLWNITNPTVLTLHHLVTLSVSLAFTFGLFTRVTAPLAWWFQLMYVHRLTGALFGLDQVLTMLLMYLMLAPCGAKWSLDALIRQRLLARGSHHPEGWLGWLLPSAHATVSAQIATRLLQLHLCVIYLFGGISKMRGEMWWDGTAFWFAVSNLEYQSTDLTWLGRYPLFFSAITNITIFWEAFYPALVWPRLTRPYVLAMAVAVHGGIALGLGMITFGAAMIIVNLAFVPLKQTDSKNAPANPHLGSA